MAFAHDGVRLRSIVRFFIGKFEKQTRSQARAFVKLICSHCRSKPILILSMYSSMFRAPAFNIMYARGEVTLKLKREGINETRRQSEQLCKNLFYPLLLVHFPYLSLTESPGLGSVWNMKFHSDGLRVFQ